jgi:hypothetical protein
VLNVSADEVTEITAETTTAVIKASLSVGTSGSSAIKAGAEGAVSCSDRVDSKVASTKVDSAASAAPAVSAEGEDRDQAAMDGDGEEDEEGEGEENANMNSAASAAYIVDGIVDTTSSQRSRAVAPPSLSPGRARPLLPVTACLNVLPGRAKRSSGRP